MTAAGTTGSDGAGGRARRGRRGPAEATSLGSVSRPANGHAPGAAECEACGSASLTRLHLVLGDGTEVTFVSCHSCEHKGWYPMTGDGTAMTRDEVIARTARRGPGAG